MNAHLAFVFFRYKLIRRRVIWLTGQWISVKFKPELRPLLYEVILSLMQDPDLVVSDSFFCIFKQSDTLMLLLAREQSPTPNEYC